MSFEPDDGAGPTTLRGGTARTALGIGIALGTFVAGAALAAGEVSEVLVDEVPATPLRYSVDGRTYTWGLGTNRRMRGFVAAGIGYGYTDTVTRVELRTAEVGVGAGPCDVFVERLDASGDALAADYPSDGSAGDGPDAGGCDPASLLASRIVNRGALDLFSNADGGGVERADFVFDHGVLAPFAHDGRARAGHVVGETSGDDPVRIAAILELDVFGQPAEYGPLIRIDTADCASKRLCYGRTDLAHEYSFFRNAGAGSPGFPAEAGQSSETVAMAFVDLQRLGLHAGQRYFGFSLFADDVDRNVHALADPATFPAHTSGERSPAGDGADVHGGLAGYFVADELNGATGRVYLDEDDDGAFGEGDAGIPDIGLTLYADTNGDGAFDPLTDRALSDSIDSDARGLFQFPGLEDGGFFVVLHEGDPDLPGGLDIAPGVNPQAVYVSGADVDGVDFPFSNGDAPSGGAGGDAGGQGDAGDTGDGGLEDAGAGTDDVGDSGQNGNDQDGNDQDGNDQDGNDQDGGAGAQGGQGGRGDDAGGATDGDGATDAGAGGGSADGGDADAGNADAGGEAGPGDGGAATTGDTGGDGTGGEAGGDDGQADGTGNTDAGGGEAGDGGDADGGGVGNVDGATTTGDGTGAASGGGTDDGQADGGGDGGAGTGGDGATDAGGNDGAGAGDGDTDAGDADGDTDGGGVIGAPDADDADGGGATGGPPDADDSSTNAVADSDTTRQGEPVEIDVLFNDTDSVGAGLSIGAVSDPPDGTATVIEPSTPGGRQTVRYEPDFGFFGTDTFMYTIADGDGTMATGTVSVAVERFSDIDGNGLNDFDQCQCESLTLETGLNGSGIGRVSPAALAGLGALLLAGARRRRRVRVTTVAPTGAPTGARA